MSPPSKDITKKPLQEPTQAPFTLLLWRARGTVGGSLEDSRTGLNTVEASNRPQQIDHLKSGPTSHVNPIVGVEINTL
jgi:hypothetical protein